MFDRNVSPSQSPWSSPVILVKKKDGSLHFCVDYRKVAEDNREKTAFSTRNGLFQFDVMPFGLCNALARFQRLMDMVLAGLLWDICLVYIDDVIIMGRDCNSHLTNIANVLHRLWDASLKVKPSKCNFLKKEVLFSGHVISDKDFSQEFILDKDASNEGIRAVLSQCKEGKEHVIVYAS
uniref:Reverse transcriptase domain-containing protein n=1 Tax=Amphimedon queenslandica TaxID=400682 RepID=A0A1X7TC64_AMPQE